MNELIDINARSVFAFVVVILALGWLGGPSATSRQGTFPGFYPAYPPCMRPVWPYDAMTLAAARLGDLATMCFLGLGWVAKAIVATVRGSYRLLRGLALLVWFTGALLRGTVSAGLLLIGWMARSPRCTTNPPPSEACVVTCPAHASRRYTDATGLGHFSHMAYGPKSRCGPCISDAASIC